jgi:hypothetical protein
MFTEPHIWSGGDFILAIELGPRSDQRLRDAGSALWEHPTLLGCYLDKGKEPAQQTRLVAASHPLESYLYGIATTPNGCKVACSSGAIRFDDGTDWLYFGIPVGSLGTAYLIGAYPLDDGSSVDWVLPVSDWFKEIGASVFASVAFRLGLVGFEADDASPDGVDSVKIQRDGVPERRWIGYLCPREQALHWYPPNIMRAPIVFEEKRKEKAWWRLR